MGVDPEMDSMRADQCSLTQQVQARCLADLIGWTGALATFGSTSSRVRGQTLADASAGAVPRLPAMVSLPVSAEAINSGPWAVAGDSPLVTAGTQAWPGGTSEATRRVCAGCVSPSSIRSSSSQARDPLSATPYELGVATRSAYLEPIIDNYIRSTCCKYNATAVGAVSVPAGPSWGRDWCSTPLIPARCPAPLLSSAAGGAEPRAGDTARGQSMSDEVGAATRPCAHDPYQTSKTYPTVLAPLAAACGAPPIVGHAPRPLGNFEAHMATASGPSDFPTYDAAIVAASGRGPGNSGLAGARVDLEELTASSLESIDDCIFMNHVRPIPISDNPLHGIYI